VERIRFGSLSCLADMAGRTVRSVREAQAPVWQMSSSCKGVLLERGGEATGQRVADLPVLHDDEIVRSGDYIEFFDIRNDARLAKNYEKQVAARRSIEMRAKARKALQAERQAIIERGSFFEPPEGTS
jgi:hypothetical protein